MATRVVVKRQLAEILDALPPISFARNPANNETVVIRRGVEGYWPLSEMNALPAVKALEDQNDVAALNAAIGVTAAQALAMLNGSMFGFDCPGADPLNCERAERDPTFVKADRSRMRAP